MESLNEFVQLNNEAVALFYSKEIKRATNLYGKSLCVAKRLMNMPRNSVVTDPERCEQCQATQLGSFQAPPHDFEGDEQDKYFLNQRALILQDPSPSQSTDTLSVCCAGVLFNIALLHHHSALKNGSSGSMGRAEKLYEGSLQILCGLDQNTHNQTAMAIAVASSNNLAQIQYEKCMYEEVGRRLDFIISALHECEETENTMFTEVELKGMLSNALLVDGMVASPAA